MSCSVAISASSSGVVGMPTGPIAAFVPADGAILPRVPALPFCMPRHIRTARLAEGLVSADFDSGTLADASVIERRSTSSRVPRYTAWRRCGSLVQPVKVISATSDGCT
jgi:hypothetical protein